MPSVAVDIKPEILKWAIRKAEIAKVSNEIMDLLVKWNAGEKKPTFSQVEKVSKKTNIPLGYFFLNTPPEEHCSIIDYRTIDSTAVDNPSQELLDTVNAMVDIQEWMVDYVMDSGGDELPFVGSGSVEYTSILAADKLRDILSLHYEWYRECRSSEESFRFIKNKCQGIGTIVMMNGVVGSNTHRKLDINEFRAFTLVNKYAPLIFINTCDAPAGRLFSILHEIVHVWIGKNSFYNNTPTDNTKVSDIETFCNDVAAEILVPFDVFNAKWNEISLAIEEKTHVLSDYFRCSRYVIIRKALDLGKISKREYNKLVWDITNYYKEIEKNAKQTSGGNYYTTLRSRCDAKVVLALNESALRGNIQYTKIFRMTGTNRTTFSKLVDLVGGGV